MSLGDIRRARKSKFNPNREKINSAITEYLNNGGTIERLPEGISEHCIGIYKSPERVC